MESQVLQQILSELKDIKAIQAQTNNRLDSLEELQTRANNRLDNLEELQTEANNRLDSLESKIDSIKDQISDLDSKNATNHLETSSQLNCLLEDVDYLTHKEHQTEKEVYTLRKKIEVIK